MVSKIGDDEPSKPSDFERIKMLGRGSFGTTYLVKRKEDGGDYCMKCVELSDLSAKDQQSALNEARYLSKISSPHVIKYYDSFMDTHFLYIIMDFAEKGTLDDYLFKKKMSRLALPENEVWRFFLELSIGVFHIHSASLIHRDLKTMNVFLTGADIVKIGDLGVARELGNRSFARTIVGTPYYLAPELCENRPYNGKSDMWALGCIIYELATYHKPFESANQAALVRAIMNDDPKPIHEFFEEKKATDGDKDDADKGGSRSTGTLRGQPKYSAELCETIMLLLNKQPLSRPSISELLMNKHMIEKAKALHIELPANVLANPALSATSTSFNATVYDDIAASMTHTIGAVSSTDKESGAEAKKKKKKKRLAGTSSSSSSSSSSSRDNTPPSSLSHFRSGSPQTGKARPNADILLLTNPAMSNFDSIPVSSTPNASASASASTGQALSLSPLTGNKRKSGSVPAKKKGKESTNTDVELPGNVVHVGGITLKDSILPSAAKKRRAVLEIGEPHNVAHVLGANRNDDSVSTHSNSSANKGFKPELISTAPHPPKKTKK